MKSIHILVSGQVQGVFYRSFTKTAAEKLGITGWVKNLPDGRVEALATGNENKITKFIEELKRGPPASRVDNVEITEIQPSEIKEKYTDFRISRD